MDASCVHVCACVCVCVLMLSFSELCRISSERETLLTSAEAHRTDRNPSIGLESSSRCTEAEQVDPGTRGSNSSPRVPGPRLRSNRVPR